MAKIKINNLPEGFEVRNGQVVEKMAHGGSTDELRTGDQKDYGLVAFTGSANITHDDSTEVRYSLSDVPRDLANLEAEGGETVLTDLNQDGNYGLYDIKGPRHSSGGVPMYLPDQSFIFSDTKSAKISKDDLTEFGINSRKKMTPAKVSKKYDLNKYYGAINDDYADDIQVKSAEMMLKKNMEGLSHLAYKQEEGKNFRDGVPMAAYPFLISEDIDPIQFTAQVEEITAQRAAQEALEQLPEEEQLRIALMQQMQAAAEQQQAEQQAVDENANAATEQAMIDSGMTMPQQSEVSPQAMGEQDTTDVPYRDIARDGLEVYQDGSETDDAPSFDQISQFKFPFSDDWWKPDSWKQATSSYSHNGNEINKDEFVNLVNRYDASALEELISSGKLVTDNPDLLTLIEAKVNPSMGLREQPIKDVDDSGKRVSTGKVNIYDEGFRAYLNVLADENNIILGPDVTKEYEGIRPEFQRTVKGANGKSFGKDYLNEESKSEFENRFPWVKEIAGWNYYDGEGDHWREFQEIYEKKNYELAKANGIVYQPYFKNKTIEDFTNSHDWAKNLNEDFPTMNPALYNYVSGSGFDSKHGMHTHNAPPLKPLTNDIEIQEEILKPDEEKDIRKIEASNLETTYTRPEAEWWLQDLIQLNAINNRKRKAFLPYQPDVEGIDLEYVLEDPTRAIAAINEQLGIQTQAAGMFGGAQQLAARSAQAAGKAATAIANEIGRVNQRNVSTINRGNAIQARYDGLINRERRDRKVKQYDDTQKVLQMYMDERNFDNDQYANALANAVTNRANTYNMNSIQDYYKINPLSGGEIGQFSKKAFEAAPIPGEYDFIKPYTDIYNRLATTGTAPSQEVMQGFMDMYTQQQQRRLSPQETNLQREMRNNPSLMPYGTTMQYQMPMQPTTGAYTTGAYKMKQGGSTKKRKLAVPFYVGMMGK
jgi:hypothetical protein